MSSLNCNKNVWFTDKLFEEKWESRLKIKMPTIAEQMKIMYDFVKLQGGVSTDSIIGNIGTIARCASLVKNPDNIDELWFKNYFEQNEENMEEDGETFNNFPRDWNVVPKFNEFIQYKVPYSNEEIQKYFSFINEMFTTCATEKFKKLPKNLFLVPVIATICLRCLAKKPNSVSYDLKILSQRAFETYRLIPPLSKQLFETLQNLPSEPMKCNSEAVNVLLMFLKLYNTNENNYIPLTKTQKEFADYFLLNHLKGNGIQLAYIFFRVMKKLNLTADETLKIFGNPVVNSNINKSINRLREFIDFYDNFDENSLIWWSRLLDRKWMIDFSTTMNKKLIIRIARICGETTHMKVFVNSKKYIQEAAGEYAYACTTKYRLRPIFQLDGPMFDFYCQMQDIDNSKKTILTHLNLDKEKFSNRLCILN